jgi:hypothetical protein
VTSKKKPPPAVALHSVFVRDHQRRLRLVIDPLELEARRQRTPPTNSQSQPELETPRALIAAPYNPGGSCIKNDDGQRLNDARRVWRPKKTGGDRVKPCKIR